MKFTSCGTFESGSYHLQMQYESLHVLRCIDLHYPLCQAFVAPTWVPCIPTYMESLVQFVQYIAWDMPSSKSDVTVFYTFLSFFLLLHSISHPLLLQVVHIICIFLPFPKHARSLYGYLLEEKFFSSYYVATIVNHL